MLATITKSPELALTPDESRNLAEAANAVAEFYDLETSAKTLAWGNLIMCAGGLYMPRMLAIGMRKKDERPAKTQGAPDKKPSLDVGAVMLGVPVE